MRGRAPSLAVLGACIGITPAYAGKSRFRDSQPCRRRDHPRVCGEEIDRQGHHADDWGSPPRMRGRGPQRGPGRGAPGITPAYAGKSCSSTGRAGGRGDHPRVCGEEAYCFVVCRCSVGSPPRMRGKGQFDTGVMGRVGITPAYAGKSCTVSVSQLASWDHPRVCGEKRISKPCLF